MTDDSAVTLGDRVLALDTDGDEATAVCVEIRQAIERRDQRIAELENRLKQWHEATGLALGPDGRWEK